MGFQIRHELGFPREILEIIFLYLDPDTFLSCRRVCKAWHEICDFLSERIYWRIICEKNPALYYPISMKGFLNHKHVFKNSRLWKKINKASRRVDDVISSHAFIPHMFINNEEQLCVTLCDKLVIKEATSLEDVLQINGSYSMFIKNQDLAAFSTLHGSLHLQAVEDDSPTIKTLDNVQLFRIIKDRCVYITTDKRIWECKLTMNIFSDPVSLATYYNSDDIIAIHYFDGLIYFLSYSGKYFVFNNNRLIHINTFLWRYRENVNYQRFFLHGDSNLIYSNDAILYVQLKDGRRRYYREMGQITSILLHGYMLFLGTHFGKIFIYIINELEELLYLQLNKPFMKFDLDYKQPIYAFDVYEGLNSHKLFVRTKNSVISIHFEHNL